MKKRLLAVLSLVLVACTAMLFTACGGMEPEVYENETAKVVYTDAGSKAIAGVEDYEIGDEVSKKFVVFSKEEEPAEQPDYTAATWSVSGTEKLVVYNVAADKSLAIDGMTAKIAYDGTLTKISNWKDVEVKLYDDFFAVFETSYEDASEEGNNPAFFMTADQVVKSYKVTLYNADMVSTGIVVESEEEIVIAPVDFDSERGIEGYAIDDKFYRIKDDVISATGVEYADCAISDMTAGSYIVRGDYLFKQTEGQILTYSLDTLQLISRYIVAIDYVESEIVYFENGSFLIQGFCVADQQASDYDFQMVDENDLDEIVTLKINLETKLVSVDGKVKDIECEYLLAYGSKYYEIANKNYEFGDYEAIVIVSVKAENKRMVSFKPVILGLDAKGNIDVIEEVIDNQNMNIFATKLADGNLIINDISGISYLYSADGELLATKKLSGTKLGNYYQAGEKYINATTLKEYELPEDWIFDSVKGGEIIITKEDETTEKVTYAKFVDGEAKVLYTIDPSFAGPDADATSYSLVEEYDEVYAIANVVKDGDKWKANVSIYSYSGDLLETINDAVDFIEQGDIVKVGDNLVFAIEVYTRAAETEPQTKVVYYRVG